MRLNLHNIELRPYKDATGKKVPGLWVSDSVRFERLGNQLWECQVPMRQIGKSNYFEFRPTDMGGHWMTIGSYRNRNGGCIAAEMFQAGTHVLCGGHVIEGERTPRSIIPWTPELAGEIASSAA